MRIALMSLDYPPYRSSGLSVYAESVALGLASRGHSVLVVTSSRPLQRWTGRVPAHEGIAVHRLPVGPFDWLGYGLQAASFLRGNRHRFDVVHFMDVHFAYAYSRSGSYTASLLQSFRQRLTSTPAGPYHTSWRNYVFRLVYYTVSRYLFEGVALRRARSLVATSESTRSEFVDSYGVARNKVQLVHIGVDLSRFAGGLPKELARRRLSLSGERPILLHVGFSTPRKGVEHLAEAIGIVAVPVHLVMVGKWEKGYLDRFMRALGERADQVTVAGYVSDDVLPDYYSAADAYVSPTLLEGFGIPFVEAMASGLPIVTTTGGSAPEVVGDAGLHVPPGQSEELGRALSRVLTEPRLASRLKRNGLQRAGRYAAPAVAEQFEDYLATVWRGEGAISR